MGPRRPGPETRRRERRFYEIISDELSGRYRNATAWCFSRADGLIDEYIVTNDDYVGLGAGSFSYLQGRLTANIFQVDRYIEALRAGGLPVIAGRRFRARERARYTFLMHLFGGKVTFGPSPSGAHPGSAGPAGVPPLRLRRLLLLWKEILFFSLTGALRRHGRTLLVTPAGRYHWVIMMRGFFTAVNRVREQCKAMPLPKSGAVGSRPTTSPAPVPAPAPASTHLETGVRP